MTQPWEGRSVWCAGDKDGNGKGWLEIQERDSGHVFLTVSRHGGFTPQAITMTRDEAKTFAAQMMNLANRSRP